MALPSLPKILSVQPTTARQSLTPALLFPSAWWEGDPPPSGTMDTSQFPERSNQAYRNHHLCLFGSLNFQAALRTAKILRILDPKFDHRDGAEPLERALLQSGVIEVRLLTGSCRGTSIWCARVREYLGAKVKPRAPVVEWKTSLESKRIFEVHDRFALIDDELWHFGATVGGAHRSINAYSRGWDAGETRAMEFFEEAWNYG